MLNRDTEDDEDDGGLERGIKQFSRTLSFVSMVWRVSNLSHFNNEPLISHSCMYHQCLLAIVFWKISLDFVRVVKNKNIDGESIGLEQRVE